MKRLCAVTLLTFSLSAHASHMWIDVPNCTSESSQSHGVCIKNKSGDDIDRNQLVLVQETFYQNGVSDYGLYDITVLHDNYALDFDYTDDYFKRNNIDKIVFALNYHNGVLPGCLFQLNEHSSYGKKQLVISKQGDDLICH